MRGRSVPLDASLADTKPSRRTCPGNEDAYAQHAKSPAGSRAGSVDSSKRNVGRAVRAFFTITRSHHPQMLSSPSAWWAGDSQGSECFDALAQAEDDEAASIVSDQIACAQACAQACEDACVAVETKQNSRSFSSRRRKQDHKAELERVLVSFRKQLELYGPRRSLDNSSIQEPRGVEEENEKDRDIIYSKKSVRSLRRLSANGTSDTKIRGSAKWPAF